MIEIDINADPDRLTLPWPDAEVEAQVYLVSRGVRPLATFTPVRARNDMHLAVLTTLLHRKAKHYGSTSSTEACAPVPFWIHGRRRGSVYLFGYAAEQWVVDALHFVVQHAPDPQYQQLLGLMLGYRPDAIQRFTDYDPLAAREDRNGQERTTA